MREHHRFDRRDQNLLSPKRFQPRPSQRFHFEIQIFLHELHVERVLWQAFQPTDQTQISRGEVEHLVRLSISRIFAQKLIQSNADVRLIPLTAFRQRFVLTEIDASLVQHAFNQKLDQTFVPRRQLLHRIRFGR